MNATKTRGALFVKGEIVIDLDVPVVSDLRQVHDAAQKLMHRYRGTGFDLFVGALDVGKVTWRATLG